MNVTFAESADKFLATMAEDSDRHGFKDDNEKWKKLLKVSGYFVCSEFDQMKEMLECTIKLIKSLNDGLPCITSDVFEASLKIAITHKREFKAYYDSDKLF